MRLYAVTISFVHDDIPACLPEFIVCVLINKNLVEIFMFKKWSSDDELFETIRNKLFVAVAGDVLDKLGLQHQYLNPGLKPIDPSMIVIGRAMPVLEADFFCESVSSENSISTKPFGLMFNALDDLKKNEVYVCSGSSHRYALFGGLMATRAIQCGAAGAVVHGFHRDTNELLSLKFPVASFGSYAQDQGPRGKVIDWRVPIEMDGTRVMPGDIIYGDRDGVLVIPSAVAEEVFVKAIEKSEGENKVRIALESGMSTTEAFERYGIM